jgi:hypothetical protein
MFGHSFGASRLRNRGGAFCAVGRHPPAKLSDMSLRHLDVVTSTVIPDPRFFSNINHLLT